MHVVITLFSIIVLRQEKSTDALAFLVTSARLQMELVYSLRHSKSSLKFQAFTSNNYKSYKIICSKVVFFSSFNPLTCIYEENHKDLVSFYFDQLTSYTKECQGPLLKWSTNCIWDTLILENKHTISTSSSLSYILIPSLNNLSRPKQNLSSSQKVYKNVKIHLLTLIYFLFNWLLSNPKFILKSEAEKELFPFI